VAEPARQALTEGATAAVVPGFADRPLDAVLRTVIDAANDSRTETVALRSRRFGSYDVPADRVLVFPEGLIGFADARRFVLLDSARPDSPFRCLVSLDAPELGFVVCDPTALWPSYAADLPPADAGSDDRAVLAIVTVPHDPSAMTVNLLAPLLFDCVTRTGRQVVLDGDRYSTRHQLLPGRGVPAAAAAQPAG
jgi:flagellar assembly factor FliW